MRAKVKVEFPGRPDGESLSRTIGVDEIISGDLALVAVGEKWADEIADEPAEAVALGDMKIAELKALAVKEGIDLGGARKHAAIVDAIEAARKAKA